MKKSRVIALILLGLLVVFGVLFWQFWSLGSVQSMGDPTFRLVIHEGAAVVKSGNQVEKQASSGMEVGPGDVIRTGGSSRASIVAEGRSNLRLEGDTEVEVQDYVSSWDQGFVFRFRLNAGKTWSRVLKLLDLGSVYEGETDNVVATVRGTAFALEHAGPETQLYVGHSAVIAPIFGSTMGQNVFTLNEWSNFDQEGRVLLRGDISSSTWPDLDWVADQKKADNNFVDSAKKKILETLSAGGGTPIDSWLFNLSRSSERWHLKFAGDECSSLSVKYAGRRLYHVYDLAVRGKSGLAFQHLTELEKELMDDEQQCTKRQDFAGPVGMMLLAFSGVTPEDDLYKLKLRFEDLYISLFEENSAEAFWAHALALDSRLDELERFGCRPDFRQPMERALEAVEQGLARQDSAFELLPDNLDEDVVMLLANKTHVQHVRLERFLERLEQCAYEDLNPRLDDAISTSTTSTEMMTPTSTEDINNDQINANELQPESEPNPVVTPEPELRPEPEPQVTEPTALDLMRIQLFAQPNPMNVGGVSNLYVKGFKNDGSEFDATSYANFEQIGSLGSIVGNQFKADRSGSVTIIARITDQGNELTSQVSLNIVAPMVLDYLEVSGNGSAQVYQGNTRQLTVIAHYTNGEMKTVTANSSYSVSDSTIGTMSGSVFRAGMNGNGWVTVTAEYSESGVTKQGQVSFEVIPDIGYTVTP